jgi:hypothetical protein
MTYFLERIAKLLYEQYNDNIGKHCLVFPSRRAGLYFLKYYSALLEKPVWTPEIMTINDFFLSFSDKVPADSEILLFELYRVYRQLNRSSESFDVFYFWGDMLINDFDDVDKYLVVPSIIFRDIKDFKTIDFQFGDIEPEQAEIIKRFWRNFEPEKNSPEKSGFKMIWSLLGDLYSGFRQSLNSRNLGYEGMIFRDVAESFSSNKPADLKWDMVHFIGFNALNKCELTVMQYLRKSGMARFYWDYDNSYIFNGRLNSAGFFMAENIRKLGNDMPKDWRYDTFLSSDSGSVKRNIVETTSDISQVKILPDLISNMPGCSAADAHHTAVILADENLVVPLLTSLPGNIGNINITMGYPLKMTGVYSFVRNLLNMQRSIRTIDGEIYFRYQDVFEIVNHRLVADLANGEDKKVTDAITRGNLNLVPSNKLRGNEIFTIIFRKTEDPVKFSEYLKEILAIVVSHQKGADTDSGGNYTNRKLVCEFIYYVMLSINRLDTLIKSHEISFTNETYSRILDKILKNQSVPFSGEPLAGIQIMGFLETRALDFRNIIMLSVNEGILPSVTSASSFIPFSIRQAFGLPEINHQESVYAYHFFRLLHRAENVIFVYNSDSSGLRTGEISRFLIQMRYEQPDKLDVQSLSYDIRSVKTIGPALEKGEIQLERLKSFYAGPDRNSALSPTAINTWLGCRMRFYYRYVCRLKEPETISAEIDHARFGQILHRIMRRIYADYINMEISAGYLGSLAGNEQLLLKIISEASVEGTDIESDRPPGGNDLILRDILLVYLKNILKVDRELAPFMVIGLEIPSYFSLPINTGGDITQIRLGGSIDRIDITGLAARIVDYKTGEVADKISSIDDLFEDDRKKDLDGWLQTLLYCEAFVAQNENAMVRPSIYKVKELSAGKFNDILRISENRKSEIHVDDYRKIRTLFLQGLSGVIEAILSPSEPFRMTKSIYKCIYCPYRGLCQR